MHTVQPKTLLARIAKTAEEIVTEHFDAELNEIEFAVIEREAERIGAHLSALVEQTRKFAEPFGLTIEERPVHKHIRGFTTSSHDRWYGPGASKTHGGSGCEILYGFAGDAHLAQINPFKQDVLSLLGG